MHFTRLRLSGFKSFVDPTELRIEPGLTGIVGPNGCGKSNLVEALRWVMGENSAKSMRGSGMDDVIFAGTDRRPARNLAEVSLAIDNGDRQAPSAFNTEDSLDIARRIERESGSSYRINGRDVRAKDVQLLFADAATGAHSPSMVSQGRVGALIAAKTKDRRAILEEAAGISGLHSRRKEAEQRLRAAETNLTRLQDVVGQLESQIANLKRQARQATRYRNISGDIRKAEAQILYRKWRETADQAEKLEQTLHQTEVDVAKWTARSTALEREHGELAARVPEARTSEAEAAAAVQRLVLAQKELAAEEGRRTQALERLHNQLADTEKDLVREDEARRDALAACERLDGERIRLKEADHNRHEAENAAKQALDEASSQAQNAEADYDALAQRLSEARGRKASLKSDLAALVRRIDQLREDHAKTRTSIAELEVESDAARRLSEASDAVRSREAEVSHLTASIEDAVRRSGDMRSVFEAAQEQLSSRKSEVSAMDADITALEGRLKVQDASMGSAIAERLSVPPGYENLIGALLGSDIEASQNTQDDVHWRTAPPYEAAQPLPENVRPFSEIIEAPTALHRRLSQTGVVPKIEDAIAQMPNLFPGQTLVSEDGAIVRWDGLVKAAGAPSETARRLQHKNRLAGLKRDRHQLIASFEEAEEKFSDAKQGLEQAQDDEKVLRKKAADAEAALRHARQSLNDAQAVIARQESRLAGLKETLERLVADLQAGESKKAEIETYLDDLPDQEKLENQLGKARTDVEAKRNALADKRAAYDALRREAQARGDRLNAIDGELVAWKQRLKRADDQLQQLEKRKAQTQSDIEDNTLSPEVYEKKRHDIADALENAELARQEKSDALAEMEASLSEKRQALKEAQEAHSTAREERARVQADLDNVRARRQELASLSGERFQCPPPDLITRAGLGEEDALPEREILEKRLEKLKAERERLGAVNLRADEELKAYEEQLEALLNERQDLETAIGRLRQAIGSLNREGRERLLAAFTDVNRHFSDLFQTLFGGGRAHLELVESDDPLDAGIEIMASPPGKKLQVLSLLSGGEQALTALSLIFAVFMTNPAPICVLDEVDAPLDEANVERLCNLLDGLNAKTQTRFLIVTHNEVTMARMHRLFGVTMAERGISQLVSVDLERAEELVAAE